MNLLQMEIKSAKDEMEHQLVKEELSFEEKCRWIRLMLQLFRLEKKAAHLEKEDADWEIESKRYKVKFRLLSSGLYLSLIVSLCLSIYMIVTVGLQYLAGYVSLLSVATTVVSIVGYIRTFVTMPKEWLEQQKSAFRWSPSEPPEQITLLINLLTPPKEREAVEGDLLESYQRMAAKHGVPTARFDYLCQISSLLWPRVKNVVKAIFKIVVARWMAG